MIILNSDQQFLMEKLYKAMYPELLRYAKKILRDPELAEEAVQETFKIACLRIDTLATNPHPNGWLVNTLKYTMSNMVKKQQHTDALFVSDRELDVNTPATPDEISIDTKVACEEIIGPEDFRLLKRVALKEATIGEAAQEAGISRDACSKRIQRSKKKLQLQFKPD